MNNDSKAAGVPVLSLLPNSPAAKAGLKIGDQIIMMNGIRTATWGDYAEAKGPLPGQTHTLEIVRNRTEFMTIVMDCSDAQSDSDPGDTILRFQAIGGLPGSEPMAPEKKTFS